MKQQYRVLLAKSTDNPDAPAECETLAGHIAEVMYVAQALVNRWGETFLETMGLPRNWKQRLSAATLKGALLHDLGKANHQFQRLVRGKTTLRQAFRHELISLYILVRNQELNAWLFHDGDDLVRYAATFAALGHHLQVTDEGSLNARHGSGDSKVVVLTGHSDVARLLTQSRQLFGTSAVPPKTGDLEIDLLDIDPLRTLKSWICEGATWWDRASDDERRLVSLVKALVMSADLGGSAVPRAGVDARMWIEQALMRLCDSQDLKKLILKKLDRKTPRKFQLEVANAGSRIALVRAGCGSGKTTAAYLWATKRAHGRKLWFCYPTTGTATEGYADYAKDSDVDATLIHSRAMVDLERLHGAPDCAREDYIRIEALQAWDVPLVVCTADTVLGLLQNNRRGLLSFPAIGNGAFVFDEVHAYDDRMFGTLLRFIKEFRGAPVLLMTASLQPNRFCALEACAREIHESINVIEGPCDLEKIPRYRVVRSDVKRAWRHVAQILSAGGKVLWVSNTVERAVQVGKEALAQGTGPVFPYHSRYKYDDRVSKHRDVIEAFRKERDGPVLAVTTQVCEVSLDLSADLLVSDLAPVPSLIQRLGRLNRFVTVEEPGKPRNALILEPHSPIPYEEADLESARKWIERVGTGPVSQADLAERLLEVTGKGSSPGVTDSAWLDGGVFSIPVPLREGGVTIPVVCAEDAGKARRDRERVAQFVIPMLLAPVANEIRAWERIGMAWVAPPGRVEYSSQWGAKWAR